MRDDHSTLRREDAANDLQADHQEKRSDRGSIGGYDDVRLVLDGATPKSAEWLHQSWHSISDRIIGGAGAPGAM
jgi:hypothetical protein